MCVCVCVCLPTPSHEQDATQGQYFEFKVFLLLD